MSFNPQDPHAPQDPSAGGPPQPYLGRPGGIAGQQQSNPLAMTSLILGGVAAFLTLVGLLIGILIIPAFLAGAGAVVTGHIARSQISRTGQSGSGLALAGIITGYVVVGFCVLFTVIAFIIGFAYGFAGAL